MKYMREAHQLLDLCLVEPQTEYVWESEAETIKGYKYCFFEYADFGWHDGLC